MYAFVFSTNMFCKRGPTLITRARANSVEALCCIAIIFHRERNWKKKRRKEKKQSKEKFERNGFKRILSWFSEISTLPKFHILEQGVYLTTMASYPDLLFYLCVFKSRSIYIPIHFTKSLLYTDSVNLKDYM